MTALQVSSRVDAWFREYAFLRTSARYHWQRLPVAVADKLLAVGAAVMVEDESTHTPNGERRCQKH